MKTFADLLASWHGGLYKGSQTAFAKKAEVEQMTVSRWVTGKSRPDEKLRPGVAKLLGVSVEGPRHTSAHQKPSARDRDAFLYPRRRGSQRGNV